MFNHGDNLIVIIGAQSWGARCAIYVLSNMFAIATSIGKHGHKYLQITADVSKVVK